MEILTPVAAIRQASIPNTENNVGKHGKYTVIVINSSTVQV